MTLVDLSDVKVILESNSREVVNMIKYGNISIYKYDTVIDDIRHILAGKCLFNMNHILKKMN